MYLELKIIRRREERKVKREIESGYYRQLHTCFPISSSPSLSYMLSSVKKVKLWEGRNNGPKNLRHFGILSAQDDSVAATNDLDVAPRIVDRGGRGG